VQMLRGDFKSGDTVIVDFVEGAGIEFRKDEAAPVEIGQSTPVSA